MIAEIAAASAAYSTIKTAIQQGKELFDVAKEVGEFLESKESLQKKAHAKGYKSDFQAFMELEKVNQMQKELKEAMVYSGRPALWQDYCAFMSDRKKQREAQQLQEIRERQKRRRMIIDSAIIIGGIVATVAVIVTFLWVIGKFKGAE